ncbi:TPA: DUF2591 family protein [Morganella morganii]|uniref:phage protein NinX family protein n=1 Tax=Morganella morganii TaxID=582 RepID=UPI002946B1C3|nr:DUF2591 family protein [Morganella morganii]
MNKYRDKSDFEINKEVVKLIKTKGGYSCVDYDEIVKVYVSQNTGIYKEFDPCNDPYDAMPIIIENGISLISDWNEIGVWGATYQPWISSENKSPLRAAMEVFLMMKDAENEKI